MGHPANKAKLGKAQVTRVEVSQGFYCPGCIQPNKQTNKQEQTNKHKLRQLEWKCLRGFTVRVLFNQTNKQTNSPNNQTNKLLFGFYFNKQTNKTGFIQTNKQTIKQTLVGWISCLVLDSNSLALFVQIKPIFCPG